MSASVSAPPAAPPANPAAQTPPAGSGVSDASKFEPVDVLAGVDLFKDMPPVVPPPATPAPATPQQTQVQPPPGTTEPDDETGSGDPADIKGFAPDEPLEPGKKGGAAAKQLRKELEERNARLKSLEDELAAERAKPRPDNDEVTSLRQRISDMEAQAAKGDKDRFADQLGNHPDVMAIKQPVLHEAANLIEKIRFSDHDGDRFSAELPGMVNFVAGMQNLQGQAFKDERAKLDDMLEPFGQENKGAIIDLLRNTVRVMSEAASKQRELANDQEGLVYKERSIAFGKVNEAFDNIANEWGRVNESDVAADPLKVSHILHRMMGEVPELKSADASIRRLVRAAYVPPPPIDPARVAMIGKDAAMAEAQEAISQHEQARKLVMTSMRDGFMSLKILPSLVKRNAELEAALKGKRRETPPVTPQDDLAKNPDDEPGDGPRDPKAFTPRDIKI